MKELTQSLGKIRYEVLQKLEYRGLTLGSPVYDLKITTYSPTDEVTGEVIIPEDCVIGLEELYKQQIQRRFTNKGV